MNHFEVQQESFSGPMHLLLELIEKEKLQITEVSLSTVAKEYLTHVNEREVASIELADFLVIASKLLYLKSKVLLPDPMLDDDESASNLVDQLRLYKTFVEVTKTIEALHQNSNICLNRQRSKALKQKVEFSMPENLNQEELTLVFTNLLKKLQPFFALQRTAIERVVSVKERIAQMHKAILSRAQVSFQDVVSSSKNKVEIVISFLALLELVKQRTVSVMQSGSFDDIEIKRVD